ncbi:hypothetical protein D3C80_731060 [compost metagenome]
MQGLVLAHLGSTAHARLSAGDADGYVGQGRLHAIRPGIVVGFIRNSAFPGGAEPAFARQIPQGAGRRSVHDAHDLMTRGAEQTRGLATARVVVQMVGRVPAIRGDVAPTAEGHLVVDDDDFLMVTGAQYAGLVEAELNRALPEPPLRPVRIEALGGGDQQRRLPDQQPHIQIRLLAHQHPQLMADFSPMVGQWGFRVQPRSGIKLPAQNNDRLLRLAQRRGERVEIGVVFHQGRKAVRRRHAPAIAPRFEQAAVIGVARLVHSAIAV